MRRRLFSAALAGLPFAPLVGASRALAQADDWPNRNVRIVCPFTPGGSQDNIARRLAAVRTLLGFATVLLTERELMPSDDVAEIVTLPIAAISESELHNDDIVRAVQALKALESEGKLQ